MSFIRKLIANRRTYWEFVFILIGFYGNWFYEFSKSSGSITENILITALYVISSLSLFLFFLELCYSKKSFIGPIRVGIILSGVHLFSTGIILILKDMLSELVWVNGIVLWVLISSYEARVAYASILKRHDNDDDDNDNDEDDE